MKDLLRSIQSAMLCVLAACIALSWHSGVFAQNTDQSKDLFHPDNLLAWCIVPFDANQRSPKERAIMLKQLGISRCAYDWREQHVKEFEDEILAYQEEGIEFFAFWGSHDQAFALFKKYELHPQIWQMVGQPTGDTQKKRISVAAKKLLPLVERCAQLKCKLAIYNHGGWGGEPANMVALCEHFKKMGHDHVGIVYNFHHGHSHIDGWSKHLELMLPHLLCVNINGMNERAQPKILPVGEGQHELGMLRDLMKSGYKGRIGILDHRPKMDAEKSLQENLEGLKRIRARIKLPPSAQSTSAEKRLRNWSMRLRLTPKSEWPIREAERK